LGAKGSQKVEWDENTTYNQATEAAEVKPTDCRLSQTVRVNQSDIYVMATVQAIPISPNKPALPLQQLSLGETFLCGGLAGCAAVTVCECLERSKRNPIESKNLTVSFFLLANIPEVMKTRLQLQGELMKTSDAPKVYANVFDVFKKTWRNEGIKGLQRGLTPAVSPYYWSL
jgi:hypothetical protein